MAAAPASLEPHLEGSDLWQRRQPLLYERLVEQAADLTIHGQLAESWETPNPTTYVFRLRRG